MQSILLFFRQMFSSELPAVLPEPEPEAPEPEAPEPETPEPIEGITEPLPRPRSMLPFDGEKKQIIGSILSVFETGKPEGDYGAVVVLSDGAGISYGKHQATDRGGNLDEIVLRYVDRGGEFADEIRPFLSRLEENGTAGVDPKNLPQWVTDLMGLLRRAGHEDLVMQQVQDDVFEERYWVPAQSQALDMELTLPLSWGVMYDTSIHSGPSGIGKIRRQFSEVPPASGGAEKEWTQAYVNARRAWLAAFSNPTVAKTKMRMDVFQTFIDAGNWSLDLPLVIGSPFKVTIR